MAKLTEAEILEELRNYDTPSITNVVATYPKNPLCLGLYNPWTENWYTDQSIRCMYPNWVGSLDMRSHACMDCQTQTTHV